jgi:cell division septation protein DedD
MNERTVLRYRILEGRPSGSPESGGPSFGAPPDEPPKPELSPLRKLGKAIVLLVFVGALCLVFFYAGEWIADHVITRSTSAGGTKPATVPAAAGPATSSASENPSQPAEQSPPSALPKQEASPSTTPANQAATASQAAAAPAQKAAEPNQPSVPVAMKQEAPHAAPVAHGIVLQVAALTKKDDAGAMAAALQKKHYPAFVRLPTTDTYYRVQVGPYPDLSSANAVKQSLERDGYQVFMRR